MRVAVSAGEMEPPPGAARVGAAAGAAPALLAQASPAGRGCVYQAAVRVRAAVAR